MEDFFYALIGICGVAVVLRAVVFAMRTYLDDRSHRVQDAGSTLRDQMENAYEVAPVPRFQAIAATAQNPSEIKQSAVTSRWGRAIVIFCRPFWSLSGVYDNGLTGRMIITFSAIIAAFGLLTIATVYFLLSASLERHAIERVGADAARIADRVPVFVSKKDISGLRALLRRHAGQSGVAYVLVENPAGEVLAHSFAKLPEEIKRSSLHGSMQEGNPRVLKVGQRAVHEIAMPVRDRKAGAVRLGIWSDDFKGEILHAVTPLIKLILLMMAVGIILAVYLAWRINRPIVKLVRAAKLISTGDLNAPLLDVEDPTEFGELSRSLERLRSSVNAAMSRLNADR